MYSKHKMSFFRWAFHWLTDDAHWCGSLGGQSLQFNICEPYEQVQNALILPFITFLLLLLLLLLLLYILWSVARTGINLILTF